MKTMFVMLTVILSVSFAQAAKYKCVVQAENPTEPNQYDQLMGEFEGELTTNNMQILATKGDLQAMVLVNTDGALQAMTINKNKKEVGALTLSKTDELYLLDGRAKWLIYCSK